MLGGPAVGGFLGGDVLVYKFFFSGEVRHVD